MPIGTRAGHPTFSQSFGEGPTTALAIHCALAHSGAWADVAGHLSDQITLTAFDLPGHGRSADWSGKGGYGRLSVDIAATFLTTPVHLIGHSFGGVAALRLAQEVPELILSLTLIEPVLFAAARGLPEWAEHEAEMAPFVAAMTAGDDALAAEEFTKVWGGGVPWADQSERARDHAAQRIHLIKAAMPTTHDDVEGILGLDALEALEMPVMLIRGAQSPSIITAITDQIAARLSDVGVADIEGAGHMAPLTHAKQVAGLIEVNITR